MRRATGSTRKRCDYRAISIHALHEESDTYANATNVSYITISIHALHEESRLRRRMPSAARLPISIHALHEESDFRLHVRGNYCNLPISIHALHGGGATQLGHCVCFVALSFQSTLSDGGERLPIADIHKPHYSISIHALHEESDIMSVKAMGGVG